MKVERHEKETIIYPEGRLDITSTGKFKDTILKAIDQGADRICLDFSSVTGIDSSGLGKLLLFQKKLKERGGELRLRNVKSDYVMKIFTLVHLYKVINIEGLSQ